MMLQITDNPVVLDGIIAVLIVLVIALLAKGNVFSKITKGSWTLKTEDKKFSENDIKLRRSNKNKIRQTKAGKSKVDLSDSDENEIH